MEVVRNAWDKQPTESPEAFEAWVIYRDNEDQRTTTAVARRLGKAQQLISRWAMRHKWTRRLDEWLVYLDQQNQADRVREKRENEKRKIATGKRMQSSALEGLLALEMVISVNGVKRLNPKVKPIDLAKLFQVGARLVDDATAGTEAQRPQKVEITFVEKTDVEGPQDNSAA